MFATGTTMVMVRNKKLDRHASTEFLESPTALKLAFCFCFVVFFSAVSLVLWAWLHVEWYMGLIDWFFGLIAAGFVRRNVRVSDLFFFGPPTLIILNAALWAWKK